MKCIVCREREAAVPDRNKPGNKKRVCRQCHGERLRGDIIGIVERLAPPPLFPCDCKQYNGGQCYNCLNGAHRICIQGGCSRTEVV